MQDEVAKLLGVSGKQGEARNDGESASMAADTAAELGFVPRGKEMERTRERDEEIGEREGFVVASLSPPMEHGNGGDSRRGSTAFAGDSEQLGGWERPDEWDPLVSGPVREMGCWAAVGCGCYAEEKRKSWAAAQFVIFFDRSNFLVCFKVLRASFTCLRNQMWFKYFGNSPESSRHIGETPHVFVLKF